MISVVISFIISVILDIIMWSLNAKYSVITKFMPVFHTLCGLLGAAVIIMIIVKIVGKIKGD